VSGVSKGVSMPEAHQRHERPRPDCSMLEAETPAVSLSVSRNTEVC
jgi:hypothetical protein